MSLTRKIEELFFNSIWAVIPLANTDVLGMVAYHFPLMSWLSVLPEIEPMDFFESNIWEKIIAVCPIPGIDKETIRIFNILTFGAVPWIGDLYEGHSSSHVASLDRPYFDSSGKASDTSRRIGKAPRSEGGSTLRNIGGSLGKVFFLVLAVGGGFAMVMATASGLGVIDNNPVMEYAGFAADKADDTVAGESASVESVEREARGPIEMITCVFSGPGCLRQQAAEERPGSEDVGETYGLNIKNFRVGSGGGIDVSYQKPGTSIPISFQVANPMNGRKGIHARDVMYRIKVIDGDRGIDRPYCDTGWLHIGTSDVDGDNSGPGGTDDIRRGTTAGTGFIDVDEDYVENNDVDEDNYAIRYSENDPLTFGECEMLQPALGEDRKIFLRLRYDYYSGGQVTFKAMSREYMLEESIKQSIQPSKAPDTPVQAAVNVKSPVTFTEENGRNPVPFGMDVFTETKDSGIRYRIQGIDVINSRFTSGMADSCSFEEDTLAPGQRMELNEDVSRRVVYNQENEGFDYWFSKGNRPSLIGCRMVLGELTSSGQDVTGDILNRISRTGETLAYRVRANYTVSKKEPLDNFEVSATNACNQMECPRLVTLSHNASSSYNYKTICEGVDASYQGCSIVDARWAEFDMKVLNEDYDTNVEQGEVAVSLGKFGAENAAAGFEKDNWKKVDSDLSGNIDSDRNWKNFSIVRFEPEDGGSEVVVLELEKEDCQTGEYSPGYPGAEEIYYKCGEAEADTSGDSSTPPPTYDQEKQEQIQEGSSSG